MGAYGFELCGLADPGATLVDAPAHWPLLELARVNGAPPFTHEEVTDQRARLRLSGGGQANLDRAASRAELQVPEAASDDAIIHPYLAPVALVMAHWLGREGFHGGAIIVDGGAWAVLGDKTAGKSTTLAWLARAGVGIVTDDVLVLDGAMALAGPRSLDLRQEAAERLDAGEPMGVVGARERWRLELDAVPAEVPLRGWITLAWGDAVAIEPIRGAQRLHSLLPHRGVFLEPLEPAGLIRLSGLPHLRLIRPQRWSSLPEATDRLLDAIAG